MMRIFCLLLLAIFVNIPSAAQTELTTEMVWQEGTHWVYPVYYWPDEHSGEPGGNCLYECKLEKLIVKN